MVFMGTPEFAVPSLELMIKSKYKLLAVVTQPDRPRGRGKKVIPSPVKKAAQQYGIPVLQPQKLSTDFVQEMKGLAPEVIVVAAYGKILPKSLLEIPPLGCINVHASLLPAYRGAAPVHRVIMNGEKITGVTIMYMSEGMDTGDIILQRETKISSQENVGSLHDRLSLMGAGLLGLALQKLSAGCAHRTEQDSALATNAPPLKGEEEVINWEDDAQKIHNQVRGMNPWPGAYTLWQGQRVKIWRSSAAGYEGKGAPGEIIELGKDSILVSTGRGALSIQELQLSGGKKMSVGDFLRGNRLKAGTVLGS
ncbi:methionyl-tRNA formyltransferase [Candidatus Contubernalis alkalaceticus]|nr:methionyl-tRNA formyltransferase [Candidatus Contubernalis alkalaceticus]